MIHPARLRQLLIAGCLLVSAGCTTSEKVSSAKIEDSFEGKEGCFLLYDVKHHSYVKVIGEENCKRRLTACSTFKVPLALMAFDSGALRDENTKLKWDGKVYSIQSWNQDHTAQSWMKNSVVWYSQLLTRKIGSAKIRKYLHSFHYGNEDFSSGIRTSWLTIAPFVTEDDKGSLKISPYEQAEFTRRFWREEFPISRRAYELTKKITFLVNSPSGYVVHGKTGSGFFGPAQSSRIGWFIAHVEGHGKEWIAVTSFTDSRPGPEKGYAGLEAKEITLRLLGENNAW
jgi:beta-lactamase class D